MLATALLVPIGIVLLSTLSPLVVMGQRFLPNRVGLASGITLGVAISIGGIGNAPSWIYCGRPWAPGGVDGAVLPHSAGRPVDADAPTATGQVREEVEKLIR